jgi:glycosyltransferase involved in cell wall biosynthesis
MAAGLPILASNVPACQEILNISKYGILLKPGDYGAWTKCLSEVTSSTARIQYLGEQLKSCANQFYIYRTAGSWCKLLSGM